MSEDKGITNRLMRAAHVWHAAAHAVVHAQRGRSADARHACWFFGCVPGRRHVRLDMLHMPHATHACVAASVDRRVQS